MNVCSTEKPGEKKIHVGDCITALTPHALSELIEHMRSDVDRMNEPKAQVLFETGAEVLIGVRTAFEHYRTAAEKAMR